MTYQATTSITVAPSSGYLIDTVSGCGGTLVNTTYTTGPIIENCSVVATFAPTLTLGSTALNNGSYGARYSHSLTATGGTAPYIWSVADGVLPHGVTLADGSISGIPTQSGSYTVTLSVHDTSVPVQTVTRVYKITVAKAILSVTALNASRLFGAANPVFSADYSGFINGDTGSVVSGTPTFSTTATSTSPSGSYEIVVGQGSLAATNYEFKFVTGSMAVTGIPLAITTGELPDGSYGSTYTQQIGSRGGVPSYTWSLASGTLPPGLSLHADSIVGTPTQAGTWDFTISVGDSSVETQTASQTYRLTITKNTLAVTAVSGSRSAGSDNGALTVSYTGFVNGDSAAALTGTPSISTTATPLSPNGTYDITVSQGTLTSDNYVFSFVNGTLSVTDMATTASGQTTAQIAMTPVAGTHVVISAGTLLTDGVGTPVVGPLSVVATSAGSISALPPAAATSRTTDGASLVSVGAALDLSIMTGTAQVKTINPSMTVSLRVPVEFASPGTPVQYYSFDGTHWTLEGGGVVKADGTVDMPVSHLSIWAVARFVHLPSGKISGDGGSTVTIADALRALQIAVGLVTPTSADLSNGDVAPIVNGRPLEKRKGSITVGDAIVILQEAIGTVSW